jgi:hypothetical protein
VEDYLIIQLVLCEKYFGWPALCELKTEMLGLLWLMASETFGEITSAEGLYDWARRAMTLMAFVLQLSQAWK